MKSSNTIVTIVIIAAVLVAAYGVGLLIHHARVGDLGSPGSVDANEAKMRHVPTAGPATDTAEKRAKLKEKHQEMLRKVETATEAEKAQIREKVRGQFEPVQDPNGGPIRPSLRLAPRGSSDPNAKQNGEKTGSEPNRAGQR